MRNVYLIKSILSPDLCLCYSDTNGVTVEQVTGGNQNRWMIRRGGDNYCRIINVSTRKQLFTPNLQESQVLLDKIEHPTSDKAKWSLVKVDRRYCGHDRANEFENGYFVMSKIIPQNTGTGSKMIEHEIGIEGGRSKPGTRVILWQHKGIYCAEPRNQIWTLDKVR